MTTSNITRLGKGRKAIQAAAQTTNRAFEADPLIRWLRPQQEASQASSEHLALRWQGRRLRAARSNGHVFVYHSRPGSCDTGAIAILFPGQKSLLFRLRRALPRLWNYIMNKLSPVEDTSADMKRVEVMMETHKQTMESIRTAIRKPVWYIEVIAVDPMHQGQGLGSQMLGYTIQQCPSNAAICLECTQKTNVAFYAKFGFEVVREMTLTAPDGCGEEVVLWVMLRP